MNIPQIISSNESQKELVVKAVSVIHEEYMKTKDLKILQLLGDIQVKIIRECWPDTDAQTISEVFTKNAKPIADLLRTYLPQ